METALDPQLVRCHVTSVTYSWEHCLLERITVDVMANSPQRRQEDRAPHCGSTSLLCVSVSPSSGGPDYVGGYCCFSPCVLRGGSICVLQAQLMTCHIFEGSFGVMGTCVVRQALS